MKLYSGIDLHSNNNVVVILDEQDQVVYERRLPNNLLSVLASLAPYRKNIQAIAVESTYNWYWLIDGLMEAGYTVKLVNTVAVKTYDGLKYTGDEHDARHLAHLLRLNILPTGHIYPKEERMVRDLLRKRGQFVKHRTAHILSIQSHMSRHCGKGISVSEIRKIDEKSLINLCNGDALRIMTIKSQLDIIHCLDKNIDELEQTVLTRAKLKPAFKKLLTVDGIGPILGMTIMYEMGDPDRFKEAGNFASYARCVNSSRWSNGKKKGVGNRKNGNKYLAWAFVEAAHYAARFNKRIECFYQRKKAKTNGVIAVKSVAHKLARACYHIIKDQVEFNVERAFA